MTMTGAFERMTIDHMHASQKSEDVAVIAAGRANIVQNTVMQEET